MSQYYKPDYYTLILNLIVILRCSLFNKLHLSSQNGIKPELKSEAWSMEQENHLCKLWSCHPCLFDVKSKDFANKPMRKIALGEIAAELDRTGLQINRY